MMKKLALSMMLLLGVPFNSYADMKHHHHDWSYEEGEQAPDKWGKLSPKYTVCATGKEQSPIDIDSSKAVTSELPKLQFEYTKIPLQIENNGHTIQINTNHQGGQLKIGNESYELIQFHAHTPAEESIDGKRAEMVVHLVHKNAAGKLAVVGVQFEEQADSENPFLATLWKVMPKQEGDPVKFDTQIDVKDLLPADHNYYTFAGSLTTPPCSEGVKWIVLKQAVNFSAAQLEQFKEVFHHNARPIQPLNDRKVLSSN
jgi:carbonic anhydrase